MVRRIGGNNYLRGAGDRCFEVLIKLIGSDVASFTKCIENLVRSLRERCTSAISRGFWIVGSKDDCLILVSPVEQVEFMGRRLEALIRIACQDPQKVVSIVTEIVDVTSMSHHCLGIGIKPVT